MGKYIFIIFLILTVGVFGYLKGDHKTIAINGNYTTLQAVSSWETPEYTKNLNDLINIVNTQNPRVALQEFAKRMQTDKIVFQNCHIIAHNIGRTAYKKYRDFDTALQYQDTICSNGYLHGVIEAKLASLPKFDSVVSALKTICPRYRYADRCWHGTGHGLMFFNGNNLPQSLSICDTYHLLRAQRRCYEGVFMENFLTDPDTHPTIYADAKYPFKPCIAQPGKYKGTCYFYVPIYYLSLHNNDYESAIQWCQGAESGYVDSCTRGVGSLAMKYNIDKPEYVEDLCMKANNVASCIDGMISYYLTFTGDLSKTAALCPQLRSSNVKACNAAVKRRVSLFQD